MIRKPNENGPVEGIADLAPTQGILIRVYDLAVYRLKQLGRSTEQLNGQDFLDVDLQIFGGCEDCGASLSAMSAFPSRSGFWKCADDIGDDGWTDDVAKADAEIRAMEAN